MHCSRGIILDRIHILNYIARLLQLTRALVQVVPPKKSKLYTSVCPPVIAVIYLYFWGSNNSIYFLFLISDRGGKERGKQIFEFLKKPPNNMIVVCSHMFSDHIGNGQLDRRESIIL